MGGPGSAGPPGRRRNRREERLLVSVVARVCGPVLQQLARENSGAVASERCPGLRLHGHYVHTVLLGIPIAASPMFPGHR